MLLHWRKQHKGYENSIHRKGKNLQITFMIKLNGVELSGNTLILYLKSLGSTANSLGDLYSLMLSVQFISVTQLCPILCDLKDCSTPGFPAHHQLPEFTQTHVHWVGDVIQPSHPLVVPFSSCLQSFPASGSFPMSQFFSSGGQSIGVSAPTSVLPMNIQDWFPLGLTGLISLQSKGLSRVFCNTIDQKHWFFSSWRSL